MVAEQISQVLESYGCRKIEAVGQTFDVLIEGRSEDGNSWSGYTPNYLRVELQGNGGDVENHIMQVRAVGVSADGERLLTELI